MQNKLIPAPTLSQVVTAAKDKVYEGVFTSWSPEGEIVLECVHEVRDAGAKKQSPDVTTSLSDMAALKPEDVKEKMVFPMAQVVTFSCVDVDPQYAAGDGFKTDGQIAKNGKDFEGKMRMNELSALAPLPFFHCGTHGTFIW